MPIAISTGDIISEKYQIDELLGEGGMGRVFGATHLGLDQRVAIKVLRDQAVASPEAVARFMREARAAAKIQSHHVARVLDLGFLEGGAPYMVMEYLDGEDLARALSRDRHLPTIEAVRHILGACEALAEVHTLGMVHRDLKPANLFLATRPDGARQVKLLDFGISKVVEVGAARNGLTLPSAVLGSPRYMSPEQVRGARDVDSRSDIWGLGVTLFELLSGETPFRGGSMSEVCAAILGGKARLLSEPRPDLPVRLCDVVDKCLALSPSNRYQDVGELARALAPFADEEGAFSVERTRRTAARSAPPRSKTPERIPTRNIRAVRRGSLSITTRLRRSTPPRHDTRATARLADRSRVPRIAVDREAIGALRARDALLLARVDGASSVEELLASCGMPPQEALEILEKLLLDRIIVIDTSRSPR